MKEKYLLLLLLLLIPLIYWLIVAKSANTELTEAYNQYTVGERTGSIAERKEAFNKSLNIYTSLENSYSPTYGNGKLYFNIANCYFQLEQYPMALFYYYKAQSLRPRDPKVTQNLRIAQEKLGIAPEAKSSSISAYITLPERLQLFFLFSMIALGFASIQIWISGNVWRRIASFFGLLAGIVFLTLLYAHFMTPVQGVLIHAASLYRDAGEQYAKVSETPLLSGTKVEVLDTLNQGTWLKIQTPDGKLGFIPSDSARILSSLD